VTPTSQVILSKIPSNLRRSTAVPLPHCIREIHELGAESNIGITFINDATVPFSQDARIQAGYLSLVVPFTIITEPKETFESVTSHALKDGNQDGNASNRLLHFSPAGNSTASSSLMHSWTVESTNVFSG
jgi:hypothetical protein